MMMSVKRALLVLLFLSADFSGGHALDSLRFLIVGDMGGLPFPPYTTPWQLATAHAMGQIADVYGPQFILEMGDNFYLKGVKNVADRRFHETFESVYKAESLQIPWYLIAGNHDHHGNVSAQIEYSKISSRWNFPNYYYYMEHDISKDKKVGFVMVDTVLLCGNTNDSVSGQPAGPIDHSNAEQQWQFVEKSLKNSRADYLFTVGHYPIYSIGEHGPTICLVQRLLPLLEKYNANGHLSGHDHSLQHLRTKTEGGGVLDFIVSGMANTVDPFKTHKSAVPEGSLQFYYGDLFGGGGFVYAEALASNMTLTFVNGWKRSKYSTVILPRKIK